MIKSEKGSVLLISLYSIALVALIALSALQLGDYLNRESQRSRASSNLQNFNQSVETLFSNSDLCLNGISGLSGLQFENSDGVVTSFDPSLAATASGQNIRFPSNLPDPQNPSSLLVLKKDLNISPFDMHLSQIYVANAVVDTSKPATTYKAEVYVRANPLSDNSTALKDRMVGNINLQINGSGALVACQNTSSITSAPALCASIGCTFSNTSLGQKCYCNLPDVSCPAGQYVAGIDPTNQAPICKSVTVQCPAGFYLSGISPQGAPICALLAQIASPPPPPPPPSGLKWHSVVNTVDHSASCNVLPMTPSGPYCESACSVPFSSISPGASCTNDGETCLIETYTCPDPTACIGFGFGGGGMSSGGTATWVIYKCSSGIGATGSSQTPPAGTCTSGPYPSGRMRVASTVSDVGGSCSSGLAQCDSATAMSCLPPAPDGTALPLPIGFGACGAGALLMDSACTSELSQCNGGGGVTCVAKFATGSSFPSGLCIGAGDPADSPYCASGVGQCTGANQFTCVSKIASGQTMSDMMCFTPPYPQPSKPTAICTSGSSKCTAAFVSTCD